jgi:hypothetical protein
VALDYDIVLCVMLVNVFPSWCGCMAACGWVLVGVSVDVGVGMGIEVCVCVCLDVCLCVCGWVGVGGCVGGWVWGCGGVCVGAPVRFSYLKIHCA